MRRQGVLGFVPRRAVVWIDGAALAPDSHASGVAAASDAAALVAKGWEAAFVPGTRPQLSAAAARSDRGEPEADSLPLPDLLAAAAAPAAARLRRDLDAALRAAGDPRSVAVVVLDVEVDLDDSGFRGVGELVGPPFGPRRARQRLERGERLREVAPGAFRLEVPEARAIRVPGSGAVRHLLAVGSPVVVSLAASTSRREDGALDAVPALAGEPAAAAVLAHEMRADLLVLLLAGPLAGTGGRPLQRRLTVNEARRAVPGARRGSAALAHALEAACRWTESTNSPALLAQAGALADALAGDAGSRVEPSPPASRSRARAGRRL